MNQGKESGGWVSEKFGRQNHQSPRQPVGHGDVGEGSQGWCRVFWLGCQGGCRGWLLGEQVLRRKLENPVWDQFSVRGQ